MFKMKQISDNLPQTLHRLAMNEYYVHLKCL